ncbi:MAG: peptide/nickel transport system permease protein, partial [Psychromonas sp.]
MIADFFTSTWLLWVLLSVAGFLFWRSRNSKYFLYVFNRYLLALMTLLIVSGIVFSLMEVLPG